MEGFSSLLRHCPTPNPSARGWMFPSVPTLRPAFPLHPLLSPGSGCLCKADIKNVCGTGTWPMSASCMKLEWSREGSLHWLGSLVEEHEKPPGFLFLLLLGHALHGVWLRWLHPPRHWVDAIFDLAVLLGVRVRVAGVLALWARGPETLTTQQASWGQQACCVSIPSVFDKATHWKHKKISFQSFLTIIW